MEQNELVKRDELMAQAQEMGIDFEQEMQETAEGILIRPALVKWETPKTGDPSFYLEMGASLLSESNLVPLDQPLSAVVCLHQDARVWFSPGSKIPRCAAVRGIPAKSIREPQSETCASCPMSAFGSECKPTEHLYLHLLAPGEVSEKYPVVMMILPPTSIKRWKKYAAKLVRSQIPAIMAHTQITLERVDDEGYTWAETEFAFAGVAPKEAILIAKQVKSEYEKYTKVFEQAAVGAENGNLDEDEEDEGEGQPPPAKPKNKPGKGTWLGDASKGKGKDDLPF